MKLCAKDVEGVKAYTMRMHEARNKYTVVSLMDVMFECSHAFLAPGNLSVDLEAGPTKRR